MSIRRNNLSSNYRGRYVTEDTAEDNSLFCYEILREYIPEISVFITGIVAGSVAGYVVQGIWGMVFGGFVAALISASLGRIISDLRTAGEERRHLPRLIKAEVWNIITIVGGVAIGCTIGGWKAVIIAGAIGIFLGKVIRDNAENLPRRHRCYCGRF